MSQIVARAHRIATKVAEITRFAVVGACGSALVAAGQALPI